MSQNPSITPAPRTITIAWWLFLLVALLHVVGLVISIASFGATSDSAKSALTNSGSGISSSTANGLIGATLAVSIVIGVLYIVAFVLFDFFMRRGANWARILLTIATVLSLFGVLGAYGVGAVGVIAAIVATVLMFLTPSNAYFREVKARKTGARQQGGYPAS